MTGKLLKYDMKSMWKSIFPFSVCMFGITILACVFARFANNYRLYDFSDSFKRTIATVSTIYLVLFAFSVAAYVMISLVFILKRYYDNFFTDEGYLTFTLPVKTSNLLNSKLIASVLASIFVSVVLAVCGLVFILFGLSTKGLIDQQVVDYLRQVVEFFFEGEIILHTFEAILCAFVQLVFNIALFQLCITIGSMIAKKHKILASIGVYMGISFLLSTVVGEIVMVLLLNAEAYYDPMYNETPMIHATLILITLLYVAGTIAAYAVNHHLLKCKLNIN